MKKKLLFVITSLKIGGAERSLAELVSRLNKDEHDITVISLLGENEVLSVSENIRLINGWNDFIACYAGTKSRLKYALSKRKISFGMSATKYYIRTKLKLAPKDNVSLMWSCFKKHISPVLERFDIAIGYGQGFATYFTVDKVSCANMKLAWVNTDLIKAGYDLGFLRCYYNQVDKVIAVSSYVDNLFTECFPETRDKTHVFPDLIPVQSAKNSAMAFLPQYENDGSIKILSVGRISKAKAFDIGVSAASILIRKGYDIKWYFVGGGDSSELKSLAQKLKIDNRIFFVGSQDNPFPWYENCDIYVQTSIFEGNCMALEEAFIFSRPIVSTNFPTACEKIKHRENGLLADMNGESVAKQIELLLTDEELRKTIIDNIQKRNEKNDDRLSCLDSIFVNA